MSDEVDAETEEVLNEFSFLGAEDANASDKADDWNYTASGQRPDDVSLGELAQLTVNNDSDINMDVSFRFGLFTVQKCSLLFQNKKKVSMFL